MSITASVVGIVLNFILARFLGALEYGNIQYLIGLANTISSFLILGLNSFITREAKNPKFNGRLMSKCFSLYLALMVFAIPLLVFVLNKMGVGDSKSIKTWSVIIVSFLIGADLLISSYFKGKSKYYLSIIFETLIPKLFLLIVSLSLILFGYKNVVEDYYLVFYIVVFGLIFVPIFIKLFKGFDLKFEKKDLVSIFFFFGVTITYSLGSNLTKVFQVALYHNATALGVISVSISVVSLARVFTSVIDSIIQPKFAECKRNNDYKTIIDLYRLGIRINSYFAIPLYLFFAVCSRQFLLMFGESYLEYPTILTIIAATYGIACLFGSNGTMLSMIEKEKLEFINGFVYFGTYLLSVFVFSFSPVYGLSIAMFVSIIIVNLVKYFEIWFIFKISPLDLKTIFSILIIFAVDFVPIYFVNKISNFSIWLPVGIISGVLLILINSFAISFYRVSDIKKLISMR